MVRPSLIAAVVVALATVAPTAAAAAGPPLPAPALAQYVESMPTSGGPVVTAGTAPVVKKLPEAVQEKVVAEAGADAAVIEEIATSSTYGAPQTTLARPAARPPDATTAKPPQTTTPSHTSTGSPQTTSKPATGGASSFPSPKSYWTDGSGESRLPILGVMMLLATVALAVASRRPHA